MRSSRNRWIPGVGAVVLVGGLLITGWGLGVTAAAPPAINPGNPFQAILDKLDQVLAAIMGLGGGNGNHTLRWDTNNASATRFTTAFPGAVLDNNTGLVWEQAPDITGGPNSNGTRTWVDARVDCVNATVGGTKGWRLPSVAELASLVDPANSNTALPTGHPFSNVQSGFRWTATTVAGNPALAWYVDFGSGFAGTFPNVRSFYTWCVRGGMNADAY